MKLVIEDTREALGRAAATAGAAAIAAAIARHGEATIVVATGASQFATLDALVAADLDWRRVSVFHLDEYVGISPSHKASFRRYLHERFLSRLPGFAEFVAIDGDAADLAGEVERLNARLGDRRVDVAFVGIGENGHLAFNDPPADFETTAPYLVVELDARCRQQQLGEGWFDNLDAVPQQAISMSVRRILASEQIVASIPDLRKAEAVRNALEGVISPECPASILRTHHNVSVYLDPAAASLLDEATQKAAT